MGSDGRHNKDSNIWLYWIFMVITIVFITIVFMGVSIINHNLTITGSGGSLQSPARWVVPPVLGICRSIEFTVEPTLAQLVGPHKLHASDEKIPISWCSTWKCTYWGIAGTHHPSNMDSLLLENTAKIPKHDLM